MISSLSKAYTICMCQVLYIMKNIVDYMQFEHHPSVLLVMYFGACWVFVLRSSVHVIPALYKSGISRRATYNGGVV
jgi:hypothetical protein